MGWLVGWRAGSGVAVEQHAVAGVDAASPPLLLLLLAAAAVEPDEPHVAAAKQANTLAKTVLQQLGVRSPFL